jgi:hypothetical protein
VLQDRLADLVEPPLLGLLANDAIRLVDIGQGLDIEPIIVEEIHLRRPLRIDHGINMGPTEPDD